MKISAQIAHMRWGTQWPLTRRICTVTCAGEPRRSRVLRRALLWGAPHRRAQFVGHDAHESILLLSSLRTQDADMRKGTKHASKTAGQTSASVRECVCACLFEGRPARARTVMSALTICFRFASSTVRSACSLLAHITTVYHCETRGRDEA